MSPRISISLLGAQSDERLLALIADGHERAFEALVQRYRRPLMRYCRRMRLSEARAEDVVQQAFLQAWQSLSRGTEIREVKPWLYRIAHNTAITSMRRDTAEASPTAELSGARVATLASAEHDRRIAIREVLSDVAELPELQRQAILQTALAGHSHDEVAHAMGLSEGAVRGLIYRARTTLRAAAAAITPQPLIVWACGAAGPGSPTSERLSELVVGGGAVGVTSVLLKGAVVAVTAAVIAGGADVVQHHGASAGAPISARALPAATPVEGQGRPAGRDDVREVAPGSTRGSGRRRDRGRVREDRRGAASPTSSSRSGDDSVADARADGESGQSTDGSVLALSGPAENSGDDSQGSGSSGTGSPGRGAGAGRRSGEEGGGSGTRAGDDDTGSGASPGTAPADKDTTGSQLDEGDDSGTPQSSTPTATEPEAADANETATGKGLGGREAKQGDGAHSGD